MYIQYVFQRQAKKLLQLVLEFHQSQFHSPLLARRCRTAAYLRQHNAVLCIGNVQEISGGSAGDSKIEDHEGMCLGSKGINSFPA